MPKHIGIVACSAEGAALCYRTIAAEGAAVMGRHDHPEMTMHTFPLARYMASIYRDDWGAVAEMMIASAEKVAGAGAEFAICPDNTIHQAFDAVVARSPIPWLHIAEAVAKDAARRGYRRLALTGTRYLMEGPVYPARVAAQGLELRIPAENERIEINRIIFDELVYGVFTPGAVAYFQRVIARLRDEEGCDAVILGCTEIPLLITADNSPLPILDSTRLLARAALRHAVEA
jgi:aspartate racemase